MRRQHTDFVQRDGLLLPASTLQDCDIRCGVQSAQVLRQALAAGRNSAKRPRTERAAREPRDTESTRRSGRNAGQAAPCYDERVLDNIRETGTRRTGTKVAHREWGTSGCLIVTLCHDMNFAHACCSTAPVCSGVRGGGVQPGGPGKAGGPPRRLVCTALSASPVLCFALWPTMPAQHTSQPFSGLAVQGAVCGRLWPRRQAHLLQD